MDIEQTKAYYAGIPREDICGCDWCQNLIDEIKGAYPEAAAYLLSLGVNIERPFEVLLPARTGRFCSSEYPARNSAFSRKEHST